MEDRSPAPPESKAERYRRLRQELDSVLDGIQDPTAAMATCAAVLKAGLPEASWVGFYRVVAAGLLRVGPYQGPLGCLEIPFDRGVCGAAARRQEPLIVSDVESFPGHIACDPATRSEIVIPVFDAARRLVAILDLDSRRPDAFDAEDREALVAIAARLEPCFPAPETASEHHASRS